LWLSISAVDLKEPGTRCQARLSEHLAVAARLRSLVKGSRPEYRNAGKRNCSVIRGILPETSL
jgi:hypothetical protein